MKFKVGDLIRVKHSTSDPKMPDDRTGLIVECDAPGNGEKRQGFTDIWRVLMTNGNILRFHEMFLELVDEAENS